MLASNYQSGLSTEKKQKLLGRHLLKSVSAAALTIFTPHSVLAVPATIFTVSTSGDVAPGTYDGIIVDSGANATSAGGVNSTTTAASAVGLEATGAGTTVNFVGSTISTSDTNGSTVDTVGAYGVYAHNGAAVTLTNGSVSTLGAQGQVEQDANGARSYALYATGAGSSISATGTAVETKGQRSYGAYATQGASVTLNDLSIDTKGFMAYGVYASGAGSTVTATNVNVTTAGFAGDAAWAYAGGHLILNGGSYTANGQQNPNDPFESANGFVAVGGVNGVGNSIIDATGVTVVTTGANSVGALTGGEVGDDHTSGTVNLNNSSITVSGMNSVGAQVSYGSTFTTSNNSSITATQGAGVHLIDNATVTLDGTTVKAGQQSFVSDLQTAGQTQTLSLGAGTVATANNGTLLQVNRTEDGADGVVTLNLNAGSKTSGDILDDGIKTTGGTDVFLAANASWSGVTSGVRNFTAEAGGSLKFESGAQVLGDLSGNSTAIAFGSGGTTIGGNVNLENGSTTTGGTNGSGAVDQRIRVAGDVFVDGSSKLGGNWLIGGSVTNNGTLNPGNSIGTVTVGGNYTFGSASNYLVEVNAAGQSDLLAVAGTAVLAGSVMVQPLGGQLLSSPYTILTAAGGYTGTFTDPSVVNGYAFLTASLAYLPTSVTLTLTRSGLAFASLGKTPNQVAVGRALDSLGLSGSLATALALGSTANAQQAFDQLTGEVHASLRTGLIEDSRHIRNAMNDRLSAAFVPTIGGEDGRGLAVWGTGFGSWGEQNGSGNAGRLDRDTKGLLIGVDTSFGAAGRVGVLGGYSDADYDVNERASSAGIKSYHVGAYAGSELGGFGLRAGASYSWNRIKTSRDVAFTGFTDSLRAKYNGATTQVFGDISHVIPVGRGQVQPFANVAYVHLHMDDFVERGGAAALTGDRENSDVTFSTLGLRASTGLPFGGAGLTAHGMVGWRHAFNDRLPVSRLAFVSGGTAFDIAGVPLSKETAVLDLGLNAAVASAASIGVSYSGQIGSGAVDNGVKANVTIRF
ncbi:autotransporter domain-containing protein [Sphingomonas paeninsulae]|uniref:Autotransporter domain-containing protein n=2 Tax=Sphingomonas paeninsulae TaxID=2319844 RepID=A0A494TCR3_SPHPE|nr:autotransporter domain-containing protein [Sphingomonas paeninsulae]